MTPTIDAKPAKEEKGQPRDQEKKNGLGEALRCFRCNSFKGSDIGGRDPKTRKLTPLFNPRRHQWARHFRWQGARLVGRTPIGRVTVAVLNINEAFRVEHREGLIEEGVFPPT